MKQSEHQKKLKAFAKRRDERLRSLPATSTTGGANDSISECAGELAIVIVEHRRDSKELTDEPVVAALQAIATKSTPKRISEDLWSALVGVQGRHSPDIWQNAAKLILKWVDRSGRSQRSSTQLLDLLETMSN